MFLSSNLFLPWYHYVPGQQDYEVKFDHQGDVVETITIPQHAHSVHDAGVCSTNTLTSPNQPTCHGYPDQTDIGEYGYDHYQTSGWEKLPWELKLRVVAFLSRAELLRLTSVSREFRMLVYDGSLWTSIDLSRTAMFGSAYRLGGPILKRISYHVGGFLRNLNLNGQVWLNDAPIYPISFNCHQIVSLDLSGCVNITESSVRRLVQSNPRLENVNFSGCPWVTDSIVKAIPRDIRVAKFKSCRNVTREGWQVVKTWSNLDTLIVGNTSFSDSAAQGLINAINLLSLDLSALPNITEAALSHLPQSLQSLCLSFNPHLTKLVTSLQIPNLRRLQFAGTPSLTDVQFLSTITGMNKLEYLDLEETDITNLTLIALSRHYKTLKHVVLSNNERISDGPVLELIRKVGLEHLSIDSCPNVTDAFFNGLLESRNKLKYLEAWDCRNVSERSVRKLVNKYEDLEVKCFWTSEVHSRNDARTRDAADGSNGHHRTSRRRRTRSAPNAVARCSLM